MFKRCFISILLLLALFSMNVGQISVSAQADECVIPPSGPWPPCATGEGSMPVPADPDCVIPPSGPWPPCATDGDTPPPVTGECEIPPSGPWPPCATEQTPPGTGDSDCVIPSSGPWPPCATGGATPEPTPEPTSEPEMTPEPESGEGEETPMPEETAEPTPEPAETSEPTPEPTETPEPTPVQDELFVVTSFEFTNITSRQVTLNFSYENMPQDGYAPLFRVVDIDNCFDKCNENLLSEYPIIGNGWAPDGLPAKGDYSIPVAIDNIFCNGGQTYMTTRLILVMADSQLLYETGSAPVDYAIEMPFEHTWCAD